MAKKTLLKIAQDISSSMDSDAFNSINDTVESLQIAIVIQNVYLDMVEERVWPTTKETLQLTASADSNKPTHMTLPDSVNKVLWLRYDKQLTGDTKTKFSDVTYCEPEEFINITNSRDSSATSILTVSLVSGIPIYIYNDRAPTYYTSFDDELLVFDAYDSVVESTLQTSKTQVYVEKEPVFTLTDLFIPDIPAKAFQYLYNESKAICFSDVKQVENKKAERIARRQRTILAHDNFRTKSGSNKMPNYGKK